MYVDYEQGKPKTNYKNTDDYKNGTSEIRFLNQKRYWKISKKLVKLIIYFLLANILIFYFKNIFNF